MPRLIDAHKLYEQYETAMRELVKNTNCENISADAPTVDAAPVKHGRWVMDEHPHDGDVRCSACLIAIDQMHERNHGLLNALTGGKWRTFYRYCPNCGAKMDLEEQDAQEKPDTIPISDKLYTIAICAVRYALGRRTYMPGLVTDWVMANFAGRMPKGTAEIMLRDIQEQREMGVRAKYDSLGDPCDVRTWEKFETWLKEEISKCVSTDTAL